MLDEEQFEQALRNIIIDLCEVLYRSGYREAPVGAIMRLIGVPVERAELHDDEVFSFDEDFVKQLAKRRLMSDSEMPPGTTLH